MIVGAVGTLDGVPLTVAEAAPAPTELTALNFIDVYNALFVRPVMITGDVR